MNQNQFYGFNPYINDINNINMQNMNNMNMFNQFMFMNMMNQFNNQFNPNMNNQFNPNMNNQFNPNMNNNINSNDEINLIFKSSNLGDISIRVKFDEKMSDIASKYKGLIGDRTEKEFFLVNKKMNLDLTVAELGIPNNSEIEVREKNENEQNNGIENKKEEKELVKKRKEGIFNQLKNGINFLGKCSNKKCQYNGQDVISHYEGEKFEVVSGLYDIMCPYCSCIIIPKKIVFYNCKFIISGKKLSENFVVPFSLNSITEINDNDNYYIFDPEYDKDTTYVELICQIFK